MNNEQIENSNRILESNLANNRFLCNQEVYSYQVLSDTTDHAIIKYTLNGSIPRENPLLILDTRSLICADISSAYDQIGQTIPRLPTIGTVNANKELYTSNNNYCEKQFDIQQGKTSLNYNYPNGIPNIENDILPSPSFCIPDKDEINSVNNIRSEEINDITSSYQNFTFVDIYNPENNIPFNFTNNDLVTFNPAGSSRFFSPTDISFYGITDNEITPLLIGLADNSQSDKTKYILLESDTLNKVIDNLNDLELEIGLGCNSGVQSRNFIEKQNYLFFPLENISKFFKFCNNKFVTKGLWKYDGGCSYRYYLEKVCVPYTFTSIPINNNDKQSSINFIIKTIENTNLGDFKFKLQTNDNINYNVLVYSAINYKKKIISNQRFNFLKILNQYDLFGKDKPIGYWSILCSCVYRYNLTTINFFIILDLLSFKKLFRENGFYFEEDSKDTMYYKEYDNTPLSKYINIIRLVFHRKKDNTYSIQIICSVPISNIIKKIFDNFKISYRSINEFNATNLTVSIFKINDFEYIYYSNYKYITDAIGIIFDMVPKKNFIISNSVTFDKGAIYLNRDIINDKSLFNQLTNNNWSLNFDYNGCFFIYKKTGNKPNIDIIQDIIVIQFQNNYTSTVGIQNQYLLLGNLATIEELLKELKHNNLPVFFNNSRILIWNRYFQPSGIININLQFRQNESNNNFSITGTKRFLNTIFNENPEVFNEPNYECFPIKILFFNVAQLSGLLNFGWVRFTYYLGLQLVKLSDGFAVANISVLNNSDIIGGVDSSTNLSGNSNIVFIYGTIQSIDILIQDLKLIGIENLIIKDIIPTTQTLTLFQLTKTNIESVNCLHSQGIINSNTNVYQLFTEDKIINNISKQLVNIYSPEDILIKPFNLNALNINISQGVFNNLYTNLSITNGKTNYKFLIDNTCNNKLCCITSSIIRLYAFTDDSNKNIRNPDSYVGRPITNSLGVNNAIAATNTNNIFTSVSSDNGISNPPINYYRKYIDTEVFDFGLLSLKLKGQPIEISGLNLTQLDAYLEGLEPPSNKNNITPTDLFFQIVNLGNKIQIIADQNILNFWKKILEFVQITYVEAGTFEFTNLIATACGCESRPIKQGLNRYTNPIMGKVIGLSNAPSRQTAPIGNLNPIVSIQTLTWSLSPTDKDGNPLGGSIQLYWETSQFNQCPLNSNDLNYLAFQIANGTQSDYGRTDALGGGFLLTDNSGQPPIGNDSFSPTGNVLMTTNGSRVEGVIIIKYTKTLNWWNNYSGFIFPGPCDSLQSAIQEQELINRVWRQVIYQQSQEATLIPLLYRLELNNRYPNRISDSNPSFIYHYIIGTIQFKIPVFLYDTIDDNEIIYNLTDILSINKYVNKNSLSFDIINKNHHNGNITISYKINFPPIQKNIYIGQNHSYTDVVNTQKKITKLNQDYSYVFLGHNSILRYISKFNITSEIEAYLINRPNSGGRLVNPKNVYEGEVRLLSIIKNMEIYEHLTNARMDIRNNPQSVGAVHYPNGVYTNNITKWLDTTVKTLLYGSEFPIRLIPPTQGKPFYSFTDGTPVKNIIYNAWGTGYNIPAVEFPSPIVTQKPNQDIQFGNLTQRNTKNKVIGGNTNVLY